MTSTHIYFFLILWIQLFFVTPVFAQPTTTSTSTIDRLTQLSEQQKEILKERKAIIKDLRESFKASLTDEQKALLRNDSMPRKERRSTFVKSLTEEQKPFTRLCTKASIDPRANFTKEKGTDAIELPESIPIKSTL